MAGAVCAAQRHPVTMATQAHELISCSGCNIVCLDSFYVATYAGLLQLKQSQCNVHLAARTCHQWQDMGCMWCTRELELINAVNVCVSAELSYCDTDIHVPAMPLATAGGRSKQRPVCRPAR
jgi:hypothetical protein